MVYQQVIFVYKVREGQHQLAPLIQAAHLQGERQQIFFQLRVHKFKFPVLKN